MKIHVVILGIATLLGLSLGLYNNFPFLYPDTASYLYSGITHQIPDDRPIWYGWFLKHTHMRDNLFFPIIAQSLLSGLLIRMFFKKFSHAKNQDVHFLVSLLIVTICTGYSFFCSYLLPDIFTAHMLLIIGMLFFGENTKKETYLLLLLGTFSTLVHNANLFIVLILILVLFISSLFEKAEVRKLRMRKLLFAFLVPVLAVFFGVLVNYIKRGEPVLSRNGHVFLTSRLNETGILQEFLQKSCGEGKYAYCAYKDSLTLDFLWNPDSPFHKLGGWKQNKSNFDSMLHDIFTDGHFLKRFIVVSFYSTLQQLFTFEIEPHNPLKLSYIRETFPVHLHDMDISFQNRGGRLNFELLNNRQWILTLISFVFLCLVLIYSKELSPTHRSLIKFLFVSLLANAFVCATFSTVLVRYQGRIIFLLPIMALLILPSLPLHKLLRKED